MSRIIDKQKFKRVYPFYRPRPQDSILDGTNSGNASSLNPNATYIVINSDPELPNERIITPGSGMNGSDGGAGGNYTLSVDPSQVAFLSGSTFTGPVTAGGGLTGSLQRLPSGLTYLAGAGTITVTTSSLGQVIISGSAGTSTGGSATVQTGKNYGNYLDTFAYTSKPSTSSTTFMRAGMFEFNPSKLTAANGTRTMKLRIIGETTGPQLSVQLYNVSTSTLITGSALSTTSLTPVLLETGDISPEISASSAIYEIQVKMNSGTPSDIVNIGYASLRTEWT